MNTNYSIKFAYLPHGEAPESRMWTKSFQANSEIEARRKALDYLALTYPELTPGTKIVSVKTEKTGY